MAAVLTFGAAGAARADTLAQAISQAVTTNPEVEAARAQLSALRQTLTIAQAGYLPTLAVEAVATASDDLRRSGWNPFTRESLAFVLDQPVLTGGRVPADVNAARASIAAGEERLRRLEGNLIRAVIAAYADVRAGREAVRIARENVAALDLRLQEVIARQTTDLTQTDVGLARARAPQSRADLAGIAARLADDEAAYRTLVGAHPGVLEPPPGLLGLPQAGASPTATALALNPLISAARYDEAQALAQVDQRRSELRPRLDLRLTLGRTWSEFPPFPRSEEAEATAMLTFRVPLFGTYVQTSEIRSAREAAHAAGIVVDGARRDVESAVQRALANIAGADAAVASNTVAVEAARLAVEGIVEEARTGTRTTFDVVSQQTELRNAELSLFAAERDAYVARADLLNAMGVLTPASIPPGPTSLAEIAPAPAAPNMETVATPAAAQARPRASPPRRTAVRPGERKPLPKLRGTIDTIR